MFLNVFFAGAVGIVGSVGQSIVSESIQINVEFVIIFHVIIFIVSIDFLISFQNGLGMIGFEFGFILGPEGFLFLISGSLGRLALRAGR